MNAPQHTAPEPPPEGVDLDAGRGLEAASNLTRFARLSFQKAWTDHLVQQATALAFITVLSLIPLLAASSVIGARFFNQQGQRTVELLSQILPYSEEALVGYIESFVDQAATIRGLGFGVLLLTALMVFANVEGTLNRIWNVPRNRKLRSRFLSFTLVLFWGPVLLGLAYSTLFGLRERTSDVSLSVKLLPALVTVLGLTMLYWLVPYTKVYFRVALAGGLVATLLIELLRLGFGLYVSSFNQYSIIYGTFGLALFFMVSIQLTWWIVLLGSEIAYCLQNYALLSYPRRPTGPMEGSWLAVVALAVVVDRFRRGQPITPQELLAEKLRRDVDGLRRALEPLMEAGLLTVTGGEDEGYVLSCDPYQTDLRQVFELYEVAQIEVTEPLPRDLADRLLDLRRALRGARDGHLESLTLASLFQEVGGEGETPEPRSNAANT